VTQPKFAPILPEDEVRDLDKLPPPAAWYAKRPADFRPSPGRPRPAGRGIAGPDQGYGLLLAEAFADELVLTEGEHEQDVLEGAFILANRRAALFGRAPVRTDLELALRLFGFLAEAPADLVAARKELFGGVAHDYWRGRELADLVPEATLRMGLPALAEALASSPSSFHELSGLQQ
jgi:hypothetical protein